MILYGSWLQLSISTRHQIALAFGIIKKAPTEVVNNTVKNDGYLIADVEAALSVEGLQKYLGTDESDHIKLWGYLVDKIEGRESFKEAEPVKEKIDEEFKKAYEPKKNAKTKKQSKK